VVVVPVPVVRVEILHRQVQLLQEQTLELVVAESHPPLPVHRFVMRPVVVEQFTGTVGMLARVALAQKQIRQLVELAERAALSLILL
jgi:hypothetical protein